MAELTPITPAPQPVGVARAAGTLPPEEPWSAGRRYADSFSLSRVREVAGKAAETGGRWLSQPIQELASLVQTVSEIFSYGALLAMARRVQVRREEEERAAREAEVEAARRLAASVAQRAEDARRGG
ncbi:MAG: hypothetical protein VKQ33_09790 [Candidatus Sericytochromatia bacterium]|nr:hypothetical protein [Candidatus Sericytochromatia bacterium]